MAKAQKCLLWLAKTGLALVLGHYRRRYYVNGFFPSESPLIVAYVVARCFPAKGGAEVAAHQMASWMAERSEESGARIVALSDSPTRDWSGKRKSLARQSGLSGQVYVDILNASPHARFWLLPIRRLRYYRVARPVCMALFSFAFRWELKRALLGARVVHAVQGGSDYLQYLACALARDKRMPFVLTAFTHPGWWGDTPEAMALYRQADAIMAMTEYERAWMVDNGVCAGRIHVTGLGPFLEKTFDAEQFREKHQIEGPMVLFVGVKRPYKGYQALADAAPLVWQRYPEAHFVFVGTGDSDSRQFFAARPDPRVIDLEDDSDKTSAYAACDIFCLPSASESFGMVYTEAWSFQKPVIGCDIPAVRCVIDPGRDGLLVQQDPQDLARAISALLDSPALRADLGMAGHEKVMTRYNWDAIMRTMEGVYRNLVS